MSLASAAIRRPVTTMMAFVSLMTMGAIATRLIPMEYFPDMAFPGVYVHLPYSGSTPEEVERLIVRPAEEVLATISGIKEIRSDAGEDGGGVFLLFDWEVDTAMKALEAREKIDGVRHLFPDDFERYYVYQQSTSDWAILELRLSSQRDLTGAYELLERKLQRPIERVDGVAQVELWGVQPREIRVELLADRVAAHRVDLGRLAENLQRANFSVTAGRITEGDRRLMVRPVGQLQTADEVRNLVIGPNGLRLSDVAEVIYGEPERDHARRLNGRFAVGLEIQKEAGANTVETTRRIFEVIDELRGDPEMEGIDVIAFDNQAEGITSSLSDLLNAGLLGAVFSILVLFFFLRQWGTTLIVAIAVPVSILITVGVLYFAGLSLNVLTMMGLMLAVGMLVDNAVVVVESVHRRQLEHPDDPTGATLHGVKEVALAVTAGTLTTAIVFTPFIVSPGDEVTVFLKHVSIAICTALAVSLAVSMTIVPIFTARLTPKAHKESRLIQRLEERYGRMLAWLLRHRGASATMIVGLLASVAVPATLINMDFFPDDNTERRIRLHYHVTDTYTLERVEAAVQRVEAFLEENREPFEITDIYSYYRGDYAQTTITLTESGETDVQDVEEMIRDGLPKLAIAQPSFTWRSSGGREPGVRVTLFGESSERLAEMSVAVADVLDRLDGFKSVRSEAEAGTEEVVVRVDRERARSYGFSTEGVAQAVSTAMRGRNLRRFRTEEGEVQLRVQFQEADRQSMAQMGDIPVENAQGERVKLEAVADLQVRRGPRRIQREGRQTMMGVSAKLDGLEEDEARARIQQVMDQFPFPPGYSWSFGAQYRQDQESQNLMLQNLLLALVLIYLVMAALFESLIHPAAIWSSILFAIVGVFWFFLITGTTFSVMAWIGVFVLTGIVVNNGIVLIDHINNLRAQGLARPDAVVLAGRERLRPILMTAATTVLGLIPLCIGNTQIGGDGPPYYPMARAIVGGLTFSTFVTLVVLPGIYVMLDDLRFWGRRLTQSAAA